MGVTVQYEAKATIVETLENNVPAALSSKRQVTHDQFNSTKTLNSGSTPPASHGSAIEIAMVAGAAQLDLRAIPASGGGTIDGNGKRVQILKLKAKADNANPILIEPAAVDGYEVMGAAFSIELKAGQEITLYGNSATPVIGAAAKLLDITGTGTQALEVVIALG